MTCVVGGFFRKVLSRACLAPLLLFSGGTAGSDYALIMPKAETSLLLGIDRAGERLVTVGERGHVLHSDDEGEHWVQARVPTSVMLTRVRFVNEQLGWAVGHDGNILFTEDGGLNWQLQRDGLSEQARLNEARVAMAQERVRDLRALLPIADDQRRRSLPAELEEAERRLEVAREAMREPVYPLPLMDIWFASEERGWAAGAFGVLLRTSNGGRFWDDWSHKVDNPEELHFNGVTGDAAGNLYLASEWGYVFRSTSSGESWEAVETGYDGSFFGVLVNPVSGSVFAYGLRGTIYRSLDQGQTWQPLDSPARASLFGAASSADGTLVFVGNEGTAIASRDDGDQFFSLHLATRHRLNDVTSMGAGRFMAVGDGGSTRLSVAPPGQFQGR